MDPIDRIRAFNRRHAARMGLLGRSYLGSGLGVTEVRVLYELAHRDGVTARELSTDLDIDEGYLSRLLGRFERKGWLARRADPADARRRTLGLTPAGMATVAPLDAASRAEIARRLALCPPDALARAAAALEAAEAALSPAPPEVTFRDLAPGDAGWLIQQHGELYARDEGFDAGFEALVAEILADFIRRRDPEIDRAWIAVRGDQRLGSIFCVRLDDETAKLRLFLLVPEARGTGLGRRLLTACLLHARACGFRRLQLWTHAEHRAACALYARSGFTLTASRAVHSFGRDLTEQTWEIGLRDLAIADMGR